MTLKIPVVLVTFLVCCSTSEGSQLTSRVSLKAMEQVFSRSEKAHSSSMATLMGSMSPKKAWQVLEKSNLTTPSLIQMTSHLHGKSTHLRKTAPTGYEAVEGARKMLNEMIYTSMSKYDAETAKCTQYYAEQCAAMQECRGQIASSNFMAATSRAKILDAQSTISACESDIPSRKHQLKQNTAKCADEAKNAKARLKTVQGDIEVLTKILEMTDCEKKTALIVLEKLSLLHCQDPCTKKSFITFNHEGLQQKVSQLQSSLSHGLLQDTFKDFFEGMESVSLLDQTPIGQVTPIVNKTTFNNPPAPITKVPSNPCTDPDAGGPSAQDTTIGKQKCTISKSPDCYKIQERFLLIQSGIKDEEENLLTEIASMEANCKKTAGTLLQLVADDQSRLGEAQVRLADGTKFEAQAGENARQTAKQHEQLNNDLKMQMKSCSANYINYESEMCALKKIRAELYVKLKGGHSIFFQDCQVDKWKPEECSKKCAGGEQKLTRSVMTHANKGAKCLPLTALKKCNLDPCPVDCELESWSDYSKCSAQCGGGVKQRLRDVRVAMRNGGNACGETSQTKACNVQACEKDCELGAWAEWGPCSKDCDGGTQKRQKFVSQQAEGEGKCPGKWSSKRLEYKECNMDQCGLTMGAKTLACKEELDIVLLLDGSGSLGQKGWDAEIVAANTFVDAFAGTGAQSNLAVILYSGPRTWSGVRECIGRNTKNVDLVNVCKIKSVTHFTSDMAKVKTEIGKLTWPQGSTLTSLALLSAGTELDSGGRKDAKSIVVTITDGRPLSYRATKRASKFLRRKARLIWVAVTRYAPLRNIKRWATRRWQENVVKVNEFKDLENPDVVTHVVANICPHSH